MRSSVRSRLAPLRMTENGRRRSKGIRLPDGRPPISFRCDLSVSSSAKAFDVKEGSKGPARGFCPQSSVLRLPISDIVKRKRIRLSDVGRRESEDRFICPLSSVLCRLISNQSWVSQPDRSDPRMRLKQNWSFQRQGDFRRRKT
jgi:hypothetical protein